MANRRILAFLLPIAPWVAGQQYGALDMELNGLMPRYFFDEPILARRDGPPCAQGEHRCKCGHDSVICARETRLFGILTFFLGIDVKQNNLCCPNNQYCYVRPDGTGGCCLIGSNCNSQCSATAYQCANVITVEGATSTSTACCPRACTETSAFQCEAEFGGGCCSYGQTCRSGKICVAAATSSTSPLVTPVDEGCTTSQFRCPDGNGCCNNWMHCTNYQGTAACAPGNPTMTGMVMEYQSQGLSDGAKAGIGVGVSVVTCLIVGITTWVCLKRRRDRQRTSTNPSGSGREGGLGGGGLDVMSETGTFDSRPTPRHGLTQDYSGPDAVAGPYTENENSRLSTYGLARARPNDPHGPEDIAAPVEMDTGTRARGSLEDPTQTTMQRNTPDGVEGRFELYGSELPSPSPPVVTPGSVHTVSDKSPGP
jgi:hypothetical protein